MGFIFGLLGVVLLLGLPAAVIWLIVDHRRLSRRVALLERGPDAAAGAPAPSVERSEAPASEPAPPATEEPPRPARDAIAEPASAPPAPADSVPPVIVFRPERLTQLGHWLRDNWFLVVAAVSLGLAGVFLVQYGIESGILTPPMRVLGAVVLGLVLIGAGEGVRRTLASADAQIRETIASAFGGAGLVSIFAGILAARQLYGLIGPELAFAALALTAAGGVLLGWLHGPFLASIGLLGGVAAPFLVGGDAESPYWLYAYFWGVAALGLAIDAARRAAWISTLALLLGHGAAALLYLGQGGGVWFLAFSLVSVAASAAIPVWSLVPRHAGPMAFGALLRAGLPGPQAWPEFPTRLVAGTTLAAAAIAWNVMQDDALSFGAALAVLLLLFAAFVLWLRDAPALDDLAVVPALAALAIVIGGAALGVPGFALFDGWRAPEFEPDTPPPFTVTAIVLGAALASALAGWRALRPGMARATWWSILSAAVAPLTVIALELFWAPRGVLGQWSWALHVIAVAALMTLLAGAHKRVAADRSLRLSAHLVMALTLISLALILWFSFAALTVALAAMLLAAALMDARFDLREMGVFTAVAVPVLLWRLIFVPGIDWAVDGGLIMVVLSHAAVLAALAAARQALRQRARDRQVALVESAFVVTCGVLASAMLFRWFQSLSGAYEGAYWQISLIGSVWLSIALALVRIAPEAGRMRLLPLTLAGLAAVCFVTAMALCLTLASPLGGYLTTVVLGPWILNTLLVAYGLPGALLLAAPHIARLGHPMAVGTLRAAGVFLLAVNVAFEIRHIWRGRNLSVPGVTDPELYSYTLALMLTAAGLMLAAWIRRSPSLRRLGVLAAAVTIAKVFLIDMSGLSGLIRVAAFLGLGLSLAGLALVNRWMTRALAEGVQDRPGAD
ncbi:DUF2339 domain-containing protein [Halovulum dunhuangense]|uniref:DUF2339 domain-containing protein n=1 Tax=Halovulum dunhuangense TaxID=1505036 RepID=A0A849L545_9RHOB|nr:DUF2339 domain-containing protein [Halovulum dunhuangense]NNU81568.1 DUF2339 domain-containing protein [Halovulum dunhuangense]